MDVWDSLCENLHNLELVVHLFHFTILIRLQLPHDLHRGNAKEFLKYLYNGNNNRVLKQQYDNCMLLSELEFKFDIQTDFTLFLYNLINKILIMEISWYYWNVEWFVLKFDIFRCFIKLYQNKLRWNHF